MPKQVALISVAGLRNQAKVAEAHVLPSFQTIPHQHYVVTIGKTPGGVPPGAITIKLPLAENRTLLAHGIGLQIAFNEGADIAVSLQDREIPEAHFLERVTEVLESSKANILEVKDPARPETSILVYTKSAAFVPGLWAQLLPKDEGLLKDVIDHIITSHNLFRVVLEEPLIHLAETCAPEVSRHEMQVPIDNEELIRRLYQQTGLLFGRLLHRRADKVSKIAVITPYYKEPLTKLKRCYNSVLRQGTNVRHFFIADGYPRSELDQWRATHIVLPTCHRDNGNTPRGLGGMIALALGFDAVAYLDADNWYADSHIKSQLKVQHENGASVICSWRIIVLPDGTTLDRPDPEDMKKSHVDTSCYLITREVSFLAALWARMPQKLGPICDRIFLGAALEAEPHLSWTHKPTVFFESNYKHHHRMANKVPNAPVHDIPRGLWRNIDPVEFRERTGKIIKLAKGSFVRRRAIRRTEKS